METWGFLAAFWFYSAKIIGMQSNPRVTKVRISHILKESLDWSAFWGKIPKVKCNNNKRTSQNLLTEKRRVNTHMPGVLWVGRGETTKSESRTIALAGP